MSCPTSAEWIEALDTSGAAPAGAHADCETCARERERAERFLRDARAAAIHAPEEDDLFVAKVVRSRATPGRWMVLAVPLAAAATWLLYLRPPDDAPVARGGEGSRSVCDVFEAGADALRPLANGDHLAPGARLAFRLRNPDPEARSFGVFAVEEDGDVAWYEPAFEPDGGDPRLPAVPAKSASLRRVAISLPLDPGRVVVYCWRAQRPWRVSDADARIEREVRAVGRPPRIEAIGGEQQRMELWFGE